MKIECPYCGKELPEENNVGCCGEFGHGEEVIDPKDIMAWNDHKPIEKLHIIAEEMKENAAPSYYFSKDLFKITNDFVQVISKLKGMVHQSIVDEYHGEAHAYNTAIELLTEFGACPECDNTGVSQDYEGNALDCNTCNIGRLDR